MADGPVSGLTVATELADADLLLISQGGVSKQIAADAFTLPFNYIGGLITSNDSGDADHDIAIAPGAARSDDDVANLTLAAILIKQIDNPWAVGDAGGLDAGSVVASQLYSLWLIKRPDTGVVDVLFMRYATLVRVTTVGVNTSDDSYNDSGNGLDIFEPGQTVRVTGFTDPANNGLKVVVSSTAAKLVVAENLVTEAAGDTISIATVEPALPTNYTKKRLIGAVKTDTSANLVQYIQSGDYFRYLTIRDDIADSGTSPPTYSTGTVSVPPNCLGHLYAGCRNATSTGAFMSVSVKHPDATDPTTGDEYFAAVEADAGEITNNVYGIGNVLVDGSSQVSYATAGSAGAPIVFVRTIGFTMLTRRDPQ